MPRASTRTTSAAIKRTVEEWNFELEVVEDEKEDVELECDGDY